MWLVIAVLISSIVIANPIDITFTSPENQDFSNYLATVTFGEALYKEKISTDKISVPVTNMGQTFEVLLDNSNTPALDYYGIKTISTDTNKVEITVYPIGYLQGKIVDKEGNLIPKAKLSFSCYSSIQLDFPEIADATGYFIVPKIPTGKCTIIAYTESAAGESAFEIKTGEVTNIEISIEKKIIQETSYVWLIILIIALSILGIGTYLIYKNNTPKQKFISTEKKEESEVKLPKQTQALLTTLSDKEKAIVEFLMANENHASQAKIRHTTKLPRTTLARTLQMLERKKLVEVSREGKQVEIRLTELFLGK